MSTKTSVTLSSDDVASIHVHYAEHDFDKPVPFPFVLTSPETLTVSGSRDVVQVSYVDPQLGCTVAQTIENTIGHEVIVVLRSGVRFEGILTSMDQVAITVANEEHSTTVQTRLVASIGARNVSHEAQLNVRLAPGEGAASVDVYGTDRQFRYNAHHAVLLEPSIEGKCRATITSSAIIYNDYRTPIVIDALTLTESPRALERAVYERGQAAMMMPKTKSVEETAVPGETGAVVISHPITLHARGTPTIVSVDRVELPDANLHLISTVDPIALFGEEYPVPMDFAVRLHRNEAKFMLSGMATVVIDTDPAPGADHVAPLPLQLGFNYNAWDKDNAKRMYYRLGTTSLVRLFMCQSSQPNLRQREENQYKTTTKMRYQNLLPYTMTVKHNLRSYGHVVHGIRLVTGHALLQDKFVPEFKGDVFDAEARTLVVHVPPNTESHVIEIEVDYSNVV